MKAAIFRKSMKNSLVSIVMIGSLFIFTNKIGAADLTQLEPTLITMKIGTTDGQHKFSPDAITLETGKLYKLRLENTGVQPYYFSSPSLVDAVYTRKVVVKDSDEKVIAEIYGPVRRFEIAIGKHIEWWIYPVRTGVFDDVISTKKLALDGMRATITVK
jgi:hypothetical protein